MFKLLRSSNSAKEVEKTAGSTPIVYDNVFLLSRVVISAAELPRHCLMA